MRCAPCLGNPPTTARHSFGTWTIASSRSAGTVAQRPTPGRRVWTLCFRIRALPPRTYDPRPWPPARRDCSRRFDDAGPPIQARQLALLGENAFSPSLWTFGNPGPRRARHSRTPWRASWNWMQLQSGPHCGQSQRRFRHTASNGHASPVCLDVPWAAFRTAVPGALELPRLSLQNKPPSAIVPVNGRRVRSADERSGVSWTGALSDWGLRHVVAVVQAGLGFQAASESNALGHGERGRLVLCLRSAESSGAFCSTGEHFESAF